MKKQMKLLFTILFSCTITSVCAQLQQGQLMNIKFSTTKPIQKGDSVTIVVEWDPQYISTIIFENVYTPTKEEVNKRKFTLVVKPQKKNYNISDNKNIHRMETKYFTSYN